jgi:glucan phosphoethanolaminetransferase (alkaline phosphatase superfamily)
LTSFYSLTNQSPALGTSLSAFYQTIARFVTDNMLPSKREIMKYHHPGRPKNNVVLVIDESIRGDHLGVNGYARETTPFLSLLDRTEAGFTSWGLAVAGATCSYPSNALLLTGVRPELGQFETTMNYPTLFQYAKSMGYKTYYMDAQTNSLWNGLTDQDVSYIDEWFKAGDFGNDNKSDFRAADEISRIVAKGVGNFIVLNKRGVHFLYESSYPPEAAVWVPLPGENYNHPEFIVNSYDNGILYNVNTFFERLLSDPKILENTTILYTSDHGQTLFENQVSWLHCNYTPQEATVPLILIGKDVPTIDRSYHASHSNILPTLLDLMEVPADQRIHPYAPSLFSETMDKTTDHFFFDGSLHLIDFPDP